MSPWLLIAIAFGVTVVITRSSLFAPLRNHGPEAWRRFVSCQLCIGVWAGIFVAGAELYCNTGMPPCARAWIVTAVYLIGLGAAAGSLALFYAAAIDFLDTLSMAFEKQPDPEAALRKASDEAIARMQHKNE